MGCAKAWSPIEMLEDLLREARDGTIDLDGAIVIFPTSSPDDLLRAEVRRAGVNSDDELVLLRAALRNITGL